MSAGARIVAWSTALTGCATRCWPPGDDAARGAVLMFAQGRNRFDSTMLNAFIRMMGVYPPGSTCN